MPDPRVPDFAVQYDDWGRCFRAIDPSGNVLQVLSGDLAVLLGIHTLEQARPWFADDFRKHAPKSVREQFDAELMARDDTAHLAWI